MTEDRVNALGEKLEDLRNLTAMMMVDLRSKNSDVYTTLDIMEDVNRLNDIMDHINIIIDNG